jgi:hypothetical protein
LVYFSILVCLDKEEIWQPWFKTCGQVYIRKCGANPMYIWMRSQILPLVVVRTNFRYLFVIASIILKIFFFSVWKIFLIV